MGEIILPAKIDRLYDAQAFVEGLMEEAGFSMRMTGQISLVIEEIFVNIASHAYSPGEGDVVVRFTAENDRSAVLEFEDGGKPYNPLEKENPDTSLTAEEREVGGLGIFLFKSIMDETVYRFENGRNILTLKKREG